MNGILVFSKSLRRPG